MSFSLVEIDTHLLFFEWKPAAVKHVRPGEAKHLHDRAAGITHCLTECPARKNRLVKTHWCKERAQQNLHTVHILYEIRISIHRSRTFNAKTWSLNGLHLYLIS